MVKRVESIFCMFHAIHYFSFNLSETIDSIASSLGEGHVGTTSVTMATDQKVQDEKLLEATKQQSMQEMV
jgi:hypothetical protein